MSTTPRYTRDTYREEYILGEDFQRRKNAFKAKYPKSYYCYVCDCKRFLDFHHIDYSVLGKEDFFRDGWWVCNQLCPCKRKCHFRCHAAPDGRRLLLVREQLQPRRDQLRARYLSRHVRPSTLLYYLGVFLYRLFW